MLSWWKQLTAVWRAGTILSLITIIDVVAGYYIPALLYVAMAGSLLLTAITVIDYALEKRVARAARHRRQLLFERIRNNPCAVDDLPIAWQEEIKMMIADQKLHD